MLPFVSGILVLVPAKYLYLHSNEICNYNQLTVAGNSSVIKKTNVAVPDLGITSDNEINDVDYIHLWYELTRRVSFRFTIRRSILIMLKALSV